VGEEDDESEGWHAIGLGYQAPVVRVKVGFLATLANLRKVVPDLAHDEVAAVDAEVGGGDQAIVVDNIGPEGVHQERMREDSNNLTTWRGEAYH
jgi:hypothetical protein